MSNSSKVSYTIIATTEDFVNDQHTLGVLRVTNDTSYNDTGSIYYDNGSKYDETDVFPLESRLICGYLELILFIVGLIGNSLSIAVLTRPNHRNSSTATYLTGLAFSDIIILLSRPLIDFLTDVCDFDYRTQGEFWCKFGFWVSYASVTTSSWLLVAVTIERTLSVTFPYQVKSYCTPKLAKSVVIAIWCVMYLIYSHFLYGLGLVQYRDSIKCVSQTKDYREFLYNVGPWIDITMQFLIPCFFILIGNIVIIVQIEVNRRKRQHMTRSNRHTETSMIVTLVVVSITFILTMSQRTILYMWRWYYDMTRYTFIFAASVMSVVSNVNAAANFFLYFLCGSKFRADVKMLFKSLIKKLKEKGWNK